MPKPFEGAARNWKFVLGFVLVSAAAWAAEFFYQLYFVSSGDVGYSVIRGSALAGATFISLALFSSSIFKWFPPYAKYWYVRRSLGVAGFFFSAVHVLAVGRYILNWDFGPVFSILDPIQNPLMFGLLALPIYLAMAVTSTDWSMGKMGFNRWKALHRLVYFAYLFTVMHFLLTRPDMLMNAAGYVLLASSFLALAGELFWFLKTSWSKRFRSMGTAIGFFIIFLWLLLGYLAAVHTGFIQ